MGEYGSVASLLRECFGINDNMAHVIADAAMAITSLSGGCEVKVNNKYDNEDNDRRTSRGAGTT